MRIRRVVVNIYQDGNGGKDYEYTFSYPECKLSFKVSQTDSEAPDNCSIRICGVSKETYAVFNTEKNKKYTGVQRVEVYYGYDTDLSLVFSGTIDRVMYSFNNGSQDLIMNVSRNARKFGNQLKDVSLSGKQTIESAVNLICREFGYKPKFGKGDFSSVSVGRFCDTTTFEKAIKSVLPKDYGYYVNESDVFIYHKDKSVPNQMTIWPQNGLLAYPTEDSKGEKTTIRTVLIPSAESGMKIQVPIENGWYSAVDTGKYKEYVVQHFTTTFNNGLGTTDFECEGGLDL